MTKRILVAGCRSYNNYEDAKIFIEQSISKLKEEHTIIFVSGYCKGADMLGEKYALENHYKIERYPANWAVFGKAAGPKRNKLMAEVADYVICFWDGSSKGTKSLINYVDKLNKPLFIKYI